MNLGPIISRVDLSLLRYTDQKVSGDGLCLMYPTGSLQASSTKAVLAAARSHRAWPTLLNTTVPSGRLDERSASSSVVAFSQQKTPALSACIRSPASSFAPSIVSTKTREAEIKAGGSSAAPGSKDPTAATKTPDGTSSGKTGSTLVVAVTTRLTSSSASSGPSTTSASIPRSLAWPARETALLEL